MFPLVHRLPFADAGGPYHGAPKEILVFDGSESYDLDDEKNVSWLWDFGDGAITSGQVVSHNYSAPGNYTVTITVTNQLGGTDVDTTFALIEKDQKPPSITILQYPSSPDMTQGIYTINAIERKSWTTDN